MNVYLAGGFKTGWQDKVIEACPDITFKDPRTHGLKDPKEFTVWDLNAIDASDIIFCFMEKDNPGDSNCSLEIGYAKAKGKYVILVNQKPEKYREMAIVVSDYYTTQLAAGITKLQLVHVNGIPVSEESMECKCSEEGSCKERIKKLAEKHAHEKDKLQRALSTTRGVLSARTQAFHMALTTIGRITFNADHEKEKESINQLDEFLYQDVGFDYTIRGEE